MLTFLHMPEPMRLGKPDAVPYPPQLSDTAACAAAAILRILGDEAGRKTTTLQAIAAALGEISLAEASDGIGYSVPLAPKPPRPQTEASPTDKEPCDDSAVPAAATPKSTPLPPVASASAPLWFSHEWVTWAQWRLARPRQDALQETVVLGLSYNHAEFNETQAMLSVSEMPPNVTVVFQRVAMGVTRPQPLCTVHCPDRLTAERFWQLLTLALAREDLPGDATLAAAAATSLPNATVLQLLAAVPAEEHPDLSTPSCNATNPKATPKATAFSPSPAPAGPPPGLSLALKTAVLRLAVEAGMTSFSLGVQPPPAAVLAAFLPTDPVPGTN